MTYSFTEGSKSGKGQPVVKENIMMNNSTDNLEDLAGTAIWRNSLWNDSGSSIREAVVDEIASYFTLKLAFGSLR